MTHAEAIAHGLAMRALAEPVATYNAQHKARAHAERIGGEWALDVAGFAVYAPPAADPEPHHEAMTLFAPAPAVMRGQTGLEL